MRQNLAPLLAIWTSHITTAYASPDNSQCITGPLANPVSQLKNYGPAQTYCSQQYPATTVTITSCTTTPTSTPKRRNAQPPTINDPNNNNNNNNPQQAAFTNLQKAPSSTQQAICQCITSSSSTTTMTLTTSCPSTTTCDPQTGTCIPTRNCNNPARCDSSSYCLESSTSGACFCHPDTDDSSLGYCLSGGSECPEVYEDCGSNGDCGGGERVCIFACCREEPFCVDLRDYDPDGGNGSLVKRGGMGLNPV